jgi:hypothetical protein
MTLDKKCFIKERQIENSNRNGSTQLFYFRSIVINLIRNNRDLSVTKTQKINANNINYFLLFLE